MRINTVATIENMFNGNGFSVTFRDENIIIKKITNYVKTELYSGKYLKDETPFLLNLKNIDENMYNQIVTYFEGKPREYTEKEITEKTKTDLKNKPFKVSALMKIIKTMKDNNIDFKDIVSMPVVLNINGEEFSAKTIEVDMDENDTPKRLIIGN